MCGYNFFGLLIFVFRCSWKPFCSAPVFVSSVLILFFYASSTTHFIFFLLNALKIKHTHTPQDVPSAHAASETESHAQSHQQSPLLPLPGSADSTQRGPEQPGPFGLSLGDLYDVLWIHFIVLCCLHSIRRDARPAAGIVRLLPEQSDEREQLPYWRLGRTRHR